MYRVGVAKRAITGFRHGAGMMGYGMYFNFVDGVETDLHARAHVIEDAESGRKVTYVSCEICFITIAIKRAVISQLEARPSLGFGDDNVMLTAQHTHSGPGGYSHYAFYNMSIPGFVPEVYRAIADGIVEAIVEADGNRRPAVLRRDRGAFPPDVEVAFNRSMRAYNANQDVQRLPSSERHFAVDRVMELLRFDGEHGQPLGAINWFGVHNTSLSNDNRDINWDNKGYAADAMEKEVRERSGTAGFVSSFSQSPAGDVTPNFIFDRKKRWTRGKFEDDLQSARWHGRVQCDKAREIFEATASCPPMPVRVDAALVYVDFSDVLCDPDFADGDRNARTSPGCIGVGMLAGTREGPGMPRAATFAAKRLARLVELYERAIAPLRGRQWRARTRHKYRSQGKKRIMIETGDRRVLGTSDVKAFIVPGFLDPLIKTFKEQHRRGALGDKPWTPQVLPLQIVIIGDLALAAIPGEVTTVAGRRLRRMLLAELRPSGVRQVIVSTHANAYSGYVTTREEYDRQLYEGGHTVFGQWTLAAFMTCLRRLAREMNKPPQERRLESDRMPAEFTDEELGLRAHDGPFAENVRSLKQKG